jgi:hypothetical protein
VLLFLLEENRHRFFLFGGVAGDCCRNTERHSSVIELFEARLEVPALFRTRFSQGDSRRPRPSLSEVQNVSVLRLLTKKPDGSAGAPEPKKTETE